MELLLKVRVVWEGEGWTQIRALKNQNRENKIDRLICWGQKWGGVGAMQV